MNKPKWRVQQCNEHAITNIAVRGIPRTLHSDYTVEERVGVFLEIDG